MAVVAVCGSSVRSSDRQRDLKANDDAGKSEGTPRRSRTNDDEAAAKIGEVLLIWVSSELVDLAGGEVGRGLSAGDGR